MKSFFLFICVLFLTLRCKQNSTYDYFYFPAEWEPHEAMIVSFDNDSRADSVSIEMVKYLSKEMHVYCVVLDSLVLAEYNREFTKQQIDLKQISFILTQNGHSFCCRDPILFLKNKRGEFQLMKFSFNDYGRYNDPIYKSKRYNQSQEDQDLYEKEFTKTFHYAVNYSDLVAEGGAIEVNGKGTIIQVESVNMQRNPKWSKAEQEKELVQKLGQKKVIWLKQGPADDPDGRADSITKNYFGIGVLGHIDEFCRFVNANTILLSFPDSTEALTDPVKKITLERMKVNEEILKAATDQDGQPFSIVRVPVPDDTYLPFIIDSTKDFDKGISRRILQKYKSFRNGDSAYFVPASSYLNFLITNNMVLIPRYWRFGLSDECKRKDEQVKSLFESYFPGKKIIQVDPTGLNYRGGGIHCWSQQVPK